jgi:poly(A) polymerase
MLKLFLSGQALACIRRLRAEGLHHGLLPLLDVVLEQPMGERFVTLALEATDERVRAGKPTSPSFLFACLLWHEVLKASEESRSRGELPIPALNAAMDSVLDAQTEKLAIQRRYASDMREIWGMQPRLERRIGRSPYKLLEHLRFRAAYDFLLLRCEAGEADAALGDWWTRFIEADSEGRAALQEEAAQSPLSTGVGVPGKSTTNKRKRRRRKPAGGHAESASGAAADGDSGASSAVDPYPETTSQA